MRAIRFLSRSSAMVVILAALVWWLSGPFFHRPVLGGALALEAVIFWVCGLLYTEDYPHHMVTFAGMTVVFGLLGIVVMLPFARHYVMIHGA
ncbi:hypothetical protein CFR79_10280 [Komagataeibacter saccharivorans]|uniref:hypothetical protein n=1 Tax=Komagataeibacter saccharivorans TaxID=265959 RepID=UPI000D7CA5BE|nr:hypothetical protein [Komagataeibacter saccharivorans]PYD50317.1 hypothetical protein CFR79_10280 [Komagataeibacter saccharivorans]GBQ40029.1 hypothetical protein AA0614_1855 [Komagataeibacter saccharivorans NRIC 0614]